MASLPVMERALGSRGSQNPPRRALRDEGSAAAEGDGTLDAMTRVFTGKFSPAGAAAALEKPHRCGPPQVHKNPVENPVRRPGVGSGACRNT
jgi:hypothetical protein